MIKGGFGVGRLLHGDSSEGGIIVWIVLASVQETFSIEREDDARHHSRIFGHIGRGQHTLIIVHRIFEFFATVFLPLVLLLLLVMLLLVLLLLCCRILNERIV